MADVRLVVYRKATGSTSAETSDQYTSYNLDLQEFPNISVNYQFSDIKNPESKKGNFTQKFKLPFTDINNNFFEHWFDVNISTQYFNTRQKFDATVYVGTVPQINGYIQLKGVYKKAKYYDVVVFSNVSDLFAAIGESRLKDCLLRTDGYSRDYNHIFTSANLSKSWDGSANDFYNWDNVSLRDATAGVQKVMYPMSVTSPNSFYYCASESGTCASRYLRMSQLEVDALSTTDAGTYRVPIEQFKPSIQIKSLVKEILGKEGFTYTSTFIDSEYFGRIFMTTCGHLGEAGTPIRGSAVIPSGTMKVGVKYDDGNTWGELPSVSTSNFTCSYQNGWVPFGMSGGTTFNVFNDAEDIYNESGNYFTRKFDGMQSVELKHRVKCRNLLSCNGQTIDGDPAVRLWYKLVEVDSNGNEIADLYTLSSNETLFSGTQYTPLLSKTLPIDNSIMPVGTRFRVLVRRSNWYYDGSGTPEFTLGHDTFNETIENVTPLVVTYVQCNATVKINWSEFEAGVYNQEVDIPSCINPDILQKDFLKDIIERFNLIVTAKSDDPKNLIIEPYEDYMALGQQKHWSNKLDLSKEVIVKDTTSLQKKEIKFGDKEDVDIINKEFKEKFPSANVYGKREVLELENDFAKGTMKNKPLYSPYINSKVYIAPGVTSTFLPNMVVQYEFTYQQTEDGIENSLEETKSKLFYYCGVPANVLDDNDVNITYHFHSISNVTGSVTAYNYTTYPVCTPYDIIPGSGTNPPHEYMLTWRNKSLYWGGQSPVWLGSTMFKYFSVQDLSGNALYGKYWEPYLNELYNRDARIMECYLNLNEVDILNFSFNDEIFIKDSYWRVQKIQNYQVGGEVSTKVTLLKVVDTLLLAEGCGYVIGTFNDVQVFNNYFLWCSSENPTCTPNLVLADGYLGLFAQPQCCLSKGGMVQWEETSQAANGLYPCVANAGSVPLRIKNITEPRSMFSGLGQKTFTDKFISGSSNTFTRGSDTSKNSNNLIESFADNMSIKYITKGAGIPRMQGENHRVVLSGHTEGTTKSFAYAQGQSSSPRIVLPTSGNTMVNVTAIATVVGGTSATYTQGVTEIMNYNTAFRSVNGTTTQIGTAGGTVNWSIKEVGTTCTLYIDVLQGELRFGLIDSQSDTKRIWTLNVDLTVQFLENMLSPFGASYALWQNTDRIEYQDGTNLEWN